MSRCIRLYFNDAPAFSQFILLHYIHNLCTVALFNKSIPWGSVDDLLGKMGSSEGPNARPKNTAVPGLIGLILIVYEL